MTAQTVLICSFVSMQYVLAHWYTLIRNVDDVFGLSGFSLDSYLHMTVLWLSVNRIPMYTGVFLCRSIATRSCLKKLVFTVHSSPPLNSFLSQMNPPTISHLISLRSVLILSFYLRLRLPNLISR